MLFGSVLLYPSRVSTRLVGSYVPLTNSVPVEPSFDCSLARGDFRKVQLMWPLIFPRLGSCRRISATYMNPLGLLHSPRQLLSEHSNLHLMTSKADTLTGEWSSNQSWSNMSFVKKLKGDWKALINDYPDRFICALDNDWAERWKQNYYRRKIELWRNGLAELPSAVAHAVAHGNAERLWKLKPK